MSQKYDKYLELLGLIDGLQSQSAIEAVDVSKLRLALVESQKFFGQQIAPLPDTDAKERSYRTEISKQLRLLEIDVMFLRGARHSSTFDKRLNQTIERLGIIKQYCLAVVQIEAGGRRQEAEGEEIDA